MLPTRVRFSAVPGEYTLSVSFCNEYDCPCTEVTLHLERADRRAARHSIRIETSNWQEIDPPQRPDDIAAMVRECLEDFPASERQVLRQLFTDKREIREHLRTFRLPADWGRDGELVGFKEVVLEHRERVVDGPLQVVRRFELSGRSYMVVDLYCVNPRCDCRKVTLLLYDTTDPVAGPVSELSAMRVNLDGTWTLIPLEKCDASTARMLAMACMEKCRGLLEQLRWRYRIMQEIGERSGRGRRAEASVDRRLAMLQPAELVRQVLPDPGRNDPCPCGSGKKFKKCCGR